MSEFDQGFCIGVASALGISLLYALGWWPLFCHWRARRRADPVKSFLIDTFAHLRQTWFNRVYDNRTKPQRSRR